MDLSADVKIREDYVTPGTKEKVLGVMISSTMTMKNHFLEGEESLVQKVSNNMRGLCQIKRRFAFKSRKQTAEGLIMSKIIYAIELWGPCTTYTQQNQIMRIVCSARRLTPTADLLKATGWLSIRQLITYRVQLAGLGYLHNGEPSNIVEFITPRAEPEVPRCDLVERSFKHLFLELMDMLPDDINEGDHKQRKKDIKQGVKENILVNT